MVVSERVYYFAFGSNMSSERLSVRIPILEDLGAGRLDGWRFVCNKRGVDGTAKANIVSADGSLVWGVVYALYRSSLPELDVFEGGYERAQLMVRLESTGAQIECEGYLSDRTSSTSAPANWYKRHMVDGARDHGLPDDYVTMLEGLPLTTPWRA